MEAGMKVPNLALDACGGSFVAVDGDCIKASMKYFKDTSLILMAVLCCHDQALFLTNLWTAGEKHFYALALIAAVLAHLPPHWCIGILYDISCQLHHSLNKHDYWMDWLSCIEFSVLVFHAYGHQWSCQLLYHPRKSGIWGLSDGEGCEQFWSELWKLIPNLCCHWCKFILYSMKVRIKILMHYYCTIVN